MPLSFFYQGEERFIIVMDSLVYEKSDGYKLTESAISNKLWFFRKKVEMSGRGECR
jgi:hypothetical protein